MYNKWSINQYSRLKFILMAKKIKDIYIHQNLCISSFYCINVTKITPKFVVKEKKEQLIFPYEFIHRIKSFHSCKTFITRFALPKRNTERVSRYLFAYLYGT